MAWHNRAHAKKSIGKSSRKPTRAHAPKPKKPPRPKRGRKVKFEPGTNVEAHVHQHNLGTHHRGR